MTRPMAANFSRRNRATIVSIGDAIAHALGELRGLDRVTVARLRQEKFSAIGRVIG